VAVYHIINSELQQFQHGTHMKGLLRPARGRADIMQPLLAVP
jgi:hypothetical protein